MKRRIDRRLCLLFVLWAVIQQPASAGSVCVQVQGQAAGPDFSCLNAELAVLSQQQADAQHALLAQIQSTASPANPVALNLFSAAATRQRLGTHLGISAHPPTHGRGYAASPLFSTTP